MRCDAMSAMVQKESKIFPNVLTNTSSDQRRRLGAENDNDSDDYDDNDVTLTISLITLSLCRKWVTVSSLT